MFPLKKKPKAEIMAQPALISLAAKVVASIIRRIKSKIEDVPWEKISLDLVEGEELEMSLGC